MQIKLTGCQKVPHGSGATATRKVSRKMGLKWGEVSGLYENKEVGDDEDAVLKDWFGIFLATFRCLYIHVTVVPVLFYLKHNDAFR